MAALLRAEPACVAAVGPSRDCTAARRFETVGARRIAASVNRAAAPPYPRLVAAKPAKTRKDAPKRARRGATSTARAGAAKTPEAVAEAAGAAAGQYLREQRGVVDAGAAPMQRRGVADPLAAELRSELLPLLVLHFMSQGPTYGNQLIDRITELTGGVLTVNPNTMYPLLRGFEARGLIVGEWEHPERRSRRFYSLTAAGKKELARLRPAAKKALDSLGRTLADIRGELFE